MLLFATAGKCSSCVWAVLPDWSQKTRTRSSSKRFQMGTPKRDARWRVCECAKSGCYNQPRCNQYGVRFLCSIAVATSSQVIVWCQPVRFGYPTFSRYQQERVRQACGHPIPVDIRVLFGRILVFSIWVSYFSPDIKKKG